MSDSIQRFSSRVSNYVKFRPTYPPAVVDLLKNECDLTSDSTIADVGSGTGILGELFLRNGNRVLGVEPNREMRAAGERLLKDYPNFTSVDGKAEATTLGNGSVDFVTAGQAFHWFDVEKTREEFARILKPGGWVVLVWNERQTDSTPFLRDYEQMLLTFGTDYEAVSHKQVDRNRIVPFFGPGGFELRTFANQQLFDFESLKGRLLSASYTPEAGHPNHAPMLDALQRIFHEYQSGGRVTVEYDTNVFYGHLR
ncbi:MAG TPA: class I SAM-dependent methyltransferase [Pyrinomonadaceae bacterium]|nr:class I SAM-dependent methyltransferase [Pyrinomonadaceae bacterium]